MKSTTRIKPDLITRNARIAGTGRHKLPLCSATGLARYRDRHQARDGASMYSSSHSFKMSTFACPNCSGYHLERLRKHGPNQEDNTSTPLLTSIRRYVLFDVENLTRGARLTRAELANLWQVVTQTIGLTAHDHVVIGAARSVAHKYNGAITRRNVKWVLGANAPDAADRALLAAIDLRRAARDYDELVIISGDHAFAGLARRAIKLGLNVHVVTADASDQIRPMLSRELSAVAEIRTLVRLEPRMLKHGGVTPISCVSGRAHRCVPAATAAA